MTTRDNSEQINLQNNKVTNEAAIKLLLDMIPLGLVLLNSKRQVVYSNQLFDDMSNNKDILGKRIGELFNCIHHSKGDDGCGTSLFCKNCTAFQSINSALLGSTNSEKCNLTTSDGLITQDLDLKVHSSKYKIAEENYILFTVEDISVIKKNDETLHMFFQYIKSGVVIYRAVDKAHDFVIEYINEMAEKIDHVNKNDVLGKKVTDVFPGIIDFGLLDVIKMVYETGKPQESPVKLYTDDRIKGWRENSVFKLPTGEIAVVYNDITEKKKAEQELLDTKNRLNTIFNVVQTAIVIINPENHIIEDVNLIGAELIGLPKEQIIGNICHKFICPSDCGKCPITDLSMDIHSSEKTLLNAKGETIPILKTVIQDNLGNSPKIIESFIDISEIKKLEARLEFERNQLFTIFDSIEEPIYIADPKSYKILEANKKLKSLRKKELEGKICYEELHGFNSPCEFCTNDIILSNKNQIHRWVFHNTNVNKDYSVTDRIIKWPDGRDVRLEIAVDVTEEKKVERILKQQSLIDIMTEIGNRRAMENEFQRVLKDSNRNNKDFSIIMIDIDYFKKYNDEYGHISGDDCIRKIAQALKSKILKPLDSVYRYGGEEFLAILPNTNKSDALIVAERMGKAVRELEINHKQSTVHDFVTISQGIYCKNKDNLKGMDDIIKEADNFLYEAKANGRNCFY